jgi:hypothetical protein
MFSLRNAAIAVGAVLCLSGPAVAQGAGSSRETHVNTPPLILLKPVQKELKLSDDQIKKVEKVPQIIRAKMEDQLAELEKLEDAEMKAKSKQIREGYRKEFPKHLAEILTPEQMSRLKQISLQSLGIKAFVDPEVEKSLELTAEQKATMKALDEKAHKATFDVYLNSGGNTKAARQKIQEMNKEMVASAVAALTDKQKKAWKDLTKDPFEIKYEEIPDRPKKETKPGAGRTPEQQAKLTALIQEDLSWVPKKVAEWQPAPDEKRFDSIGWAVDIRDAKRLGKKHNRPVALLNSNGNMPLGIC